VSIDNSIIDLRKREATLQLLWIGIGSICMFFAALTSIIFVEKMKFPEIPNLFLYSTIVIVFSSILLMLTKKRIKKDKPIFMMISIVFLLGLFFAYFQFKGWGELISNKIYFSGGAKESSLLYVLTGAHLVHLFAGLIALFITTINTKRNRYSSGNYLGLELSSHYWHFLTLLWLCILGLLKYFEDDWEEVIIESLLL